MFTAASFIEETTALCGAPKRRWWVAPTVWPRSCASTRTGLVGLAAGVLLGPQRAPKAGGPGDPPAAWAVPLRLGRHAPAQMVVVASVECRVAVVGVTWVYRQWQSRQAGVAKLCRAVVVTLGVPLDWAVVDVCIARKNVEW